MATGIGVIVGVGVGIGVTTTGGLEVIVPRPVISVLSQAKIFRRVWTKLDPVAFAERLTVTAREPATVPLPLVLADFCNPTAREADTKP